MNPKVSIIVLNWNGLKDTIECLESVYKIDYPNYEVIVVDNASTDGSPDQIKERFPKITLIRNNKNLGYAGGNNIGMEYAMRSYSKYVWLLNNDTTTINNTLSHLIQVAESNSSIGLVSPLIHYYATPSRLQFCGSYIDWDSSVIKEIEDLNKVAYYQNKGLLLWGTALLVKAEVIKKVGYLNEKYFAYLEDMEFSLKALKAGYVNKIDLDSKIFHKIDFIDRCEIRNKQYTFYYITRNSYFFWCKNKSLVKKTIFTKKYIEQIMREVSKYKKASYFDAANACLEGMWAAFLNRGGRKMSVKRCQESLGIFCSPIHIFLFYC